MTSPTRDPHVRRVFGVVLLLVVFVYLAACAALAFFQRSFIYYPQPAITAGHALAERLPIADAGGARRVYFRPAMPIRKRADRFQVRVSLGDGRRVEQTLPAGARRADAVALEATLRRAVIDQVVGRPRRFTIADALDRWETDARALRSWQKDVVRFRAAVVRQLAGSRPLEVRAPSPGSACPGSGQNRRQAPPLRPDGAADRPIVDRGPQGCQDARRATARPEALFR